MIVRSKEAETKDLLRIMDVASALRKQREEVGKQLNLEETKLDLRKRILATTEFTGEKLSEIEVDKAIDSYLSGLYSFKEPKQGFMNNLANFYVNRVNIARKVGIPILAFLSLGALVSGGVKGCTAISVYHQERKVEKAVEMAYKDKLDLGNDLITIKNSPFRNQVPDSEGLEMLVANSEASLKNTDNFFKKYCSKGTASDDITKSNYLEANAQLQPVLTSLENAKRGETVVLKAVENEEKLTILPKEAERLYSSIKSEAKEREAIDLGNELYNNSQLSVKSRDVLGLNKSVTELRGIDETLKQKYTMTIVNKEGVKSGIDRYYTDEKGKRLAGFYLIVEAISPDGSALEKRIKNEEDGKTYEVNIWGERVPESVYEMIKQDKMADGRVDNNIFGVKDRGYLTESITLKDKNGNQLKKLGEITRW